MSFKHSCLIISHSPPPPMPSFAGTSMFSFNVEPGRRRGGGVGFALGGNQGALASTATCSTGIHSTMSLTKTLSLPSTPVTTTDHGDQYISDHHRVIVDSARLNGLLNFDLETGVQNGLVYRQHVVVKSFEIGPDRKVTMAALMNHLQDTSLGHGSRMGIVAGGFGGTSYMRRNNLCWVITSTQVMVDRYPSWGEVMEVEHWVFESGKNGLGNDWLIRDGKTGEVLVRATNVCVLMNTVTRKPSKFVKEVRDELAPHFSRISQSVVPRDERKIPRVDFESAHNIRTSIQPGWYDLDINNHISNIKYIDWIIESAPRSILESRELCWMTLQYKKECGIDDAGLQSLSKIAGKTVDGRVELEHLLCLEDGSEIMRARTIWRSK